MCKQISYGTPAGRSGLGIVLYRERKKEETQIILDSFNVLQDELSAHMVLNIACNLFFCLFVYRFYLFIFR